MPVELLTPRRRMREAEGQRILPWHSSHPCPLPSFNTLHGHERWWGHRKWRASWKLWEGHHMPDSSMDTAIGQSSILLWTMLMKSLFHELELKCDHDFGLSLEPYEVNFSDISWRQTQHALKVVLKVVLWDWQDGSWRCLPLSLKTWDWSLGIIG